MPLTCGWPVGHRAEDGFCGRPVCVAYRVEVRDLPLIDSDAPANPAVLTLCDQHDPARLRTGGQGE